MMNKSYDFKVKSTTPVKTLATSIGTCLIKEGKEVTVRAIGAGAVNQMYKALAIARGQVAVSGKDLLIKPGFDTINDNGETKTVMIAKVILQ